LREGAAHARAASAATPANEEAAAAMSRIASPIATPTRGVAPGTGRNTPNGRFWIGNSQSAAFALSRKLRRAGSCVSFSGTVI
jgi:hypothetical protein